MALLNVIIDETCVTIFAVKTLAQVLEEYVKKHRPETDTHDRQSGLRRRARGRVRRIVSGRIVIRHGKDSFRFFKAKPRSTGNESFQRIKRRAYFFIRWAELVIGFDPGPGNFSLLVDHINRRMRNAVTLLTFIGGITQSVGVNHSMLGVRKN